MPSRLINLLHSENTEAVDQIVPGLEWIPAESLEVSSGIFQMVGWSMETYRNI